jgi:nicotinamidase-related amidase
MSDTKAQLQFDPATTTLVLIDLQNGIVGRPIAPHSVAELLERSNRLVGALRAKGALIVFVRVAMNDVLHLPVDSSWRDPNAPPPPAIASELSDQLDRQPTDLVITKRQWGAFYGTELDQQLRRKRIRTIVLGGVATNFGVESTARAAFDRGYELIFVEDAMSSVKAEAHQFAINVTFPRMGRVRKTEEVLAALVG